MMLKEQLETALSDMETLTLALGMEPFEIYLLGGSGCILAGFLSRATRDIYFIELDYDSRLERVFKLLEPFDTVDYNLATLAPSYKKRALQLTQFNYITVFVLSREDIIISKLGLYNDRDRADISLMLPDADFDILFSLIDDVKCRSDLPQKTINLFTQNTEHFLKNHNCHV
jgi:hypothetical protein